MRELLERTTFTACFAISDMLAVGAMLAVKEQGLRIPDDLAVVGFDDIFIARIVDPPLTTVRQPTLEMGRIGVEKLLELSEEQGVIEPVRIILDTQLVKRQSA